MDITLSTVRTDCIHFRGDRPCSPHKKHGQYCPSCTFYTKREGIILVIKLGAIGDVIRTTPLLHRLKAEYPNHAIWWVTHTPEILPDTYIDKKLTFDYAAGVLLTATSFDLVINLDKDAEACALTSQLVAKEKYGFTLKDGFPAPVNSLAEQKFLTGIFDDLNKANTFSYVEEIFQICGWQFRQEEYILPTPSVPPVELPVRAGKPVIGLNTGCGERWVSRLWAAEHWEELIYLLQEKGFEPVLLGGEQEDDLNTRLAHKTGACYYGSVPLPHFIRLVEACDVVVSAVTMAMHIAIGLKKQLILFVNIFNPNEFELYGRGTILTPQIDCQCFFSPTCHSPKGSCMDTLSAKVVLEAVENSVMAIES